MQGSQATVLVLDFHNVMQGSGRAHAHAHAHTHTRTPSFLQVKVLSGANKDSVGSLLSVDEGDGIVRVKATGEVKFFSLKNLAKLHKN